MYLINWIKLRMTIRDQASWVESDLDHRLGKTQITSSFSGQNLLPWETHIEIQGIMSSVNFWQNIRYVKCRKNQIRQTAQITERQRVRRRRTLLFVVRLNNKDEKLSPNMSHLSNESSLWRSVPLHVERKVIWAGERAMAKMTFERLRTSVLPRVSETGNISILAIDCRRQWYKWLFGHPQFLKMIPVT